MLKLTHYDLIKDRAELSSFIEFLPELEEDEFFLLKIIQRHNYIETNSNNYPKDRQIAAHIVDKNSDFLKVILKSEYDYYEYPEAICIQSFINPRSWIKAAKKVSLRITEKIFTNLPHESYNVQQLLMQEASRGNVSNNSIKSRSWVRSYDIDQKSESNVITLSSILPDNSYMLIETNNGYHLHVRPQLVTLLGGDSLWDRNIRKHIAGLDQNNSNDLMSVIPGIIRGNFVPKILHKP